jgi:DNA-binding NarL/FixJ family response regulator
MPLKQRQASILIVDDHAMVREGLAGLIVREPDMTVCGGVASVEEALKVILKSPPDLIIVDISLADVSGFELLHAMKSRYPGIPSLVMSMHDENLHAERALRAGAKGYIMKNEAFDQILTAIRQVLGGEIYLGDSMRSKLLQRFFNPGATLDVSPIARLSDRELEALRLSGLGLTTAEIAEKLHRSVKTIEANRSRIKKKLNLKNNTDYMRFAVQWVASTTEPSRIDAS